jgi:hypothetical protein
MYGSTPGAASGTGQAIFTADSNDVSLQVFMEHLKHLVRLFFPPVHSLLLSCLLTACHWQCRSLSSRLPVWVLKQIKIKLFCLFHIFSTMSDSESTFSFTIDPIQ